MQNINILINEQKINYFKRMPYSHLKIKVLLVHPGSCCHLELHLIQTPASANLFAFPSVYLMYWD